MWISRCADTSSQLSETFVRQLQMEGVMANNLQDTCKKSAPMMSDKSFNGMDLPADFFFLQNDDGDTQLHLAIIFEKFEIASILISIAPNASYLDIRNDECLTALHYAVLTGQSRIARRLVLAGTNTQTRTRQGNTALHLAVQEGDVDCIKALTDPVTPAEKEWLTKSNIPRPMPQLPAHVDVKNYVGQTPLHIAAVKNDVQLVHELLLVGADVNAKEGLAGQSALHLAIEKDNAQVVHYLAQVPTTLEATTYRGEVAYQLAAKRRPHYVDALLRFGAAPVVRTDDDDDSMSEDDSSSDAD